MPAFPGIISVCIGIGTVGPTPLFDMSTLVLCKIRNNLVVLIVNVKLWPKASASGHCEKTASRFVRFGIYYNEYNENPM